MSVKTGIIHESELEDKFHDFLNENYEPFVFDGKTYSPGLVLFKLDIFLYDFYFQAYIEKLVREKFLCSSEPDYLPDDGVFLGGNYYKLGLHIVK